VLFGVYSAKVKKDVNSSFLVKTPIAHRGLWNEELPENSLGAFRNAAQHGFASELDVQLLADGEVAAFHDEDLQRLTGRVGSIKDLSTRDLKKYNLLDTGFTIPTLDEVVNTVQGKSPLLIEIKNNSTKDIGQLEAAVLWKMLEFEGEWAVQSFNPLVLKWFKDNAPDVLRGQLSGDFKYDDMHQAVKSLLSFMVFNPMTKPDFISYDARALGDNKLRKFAVGQMTKNKPLVKWGIHSKEDYLKSGKADNVIFDGFNIREV